MDVDPCRSKMTTTARSKNHVAAGHSVGSNSAKAANSREPSYSGSDLPGEKDTDFSAGDAADNLVEAKFAGSSGKEDVHVRGRSPDEHLSCDNLNPECNGMIKEGYLYDVHHESLPPRAPIQLKAIRIVLVSEKTQLNVTVKFPSIRSLRNYFAKINLGQKSMDKEMSHPKLDEMFVMNISVARRVLWREVPPAEFQKMRRVENFWMLSGELILSMHDLPILSSTRSSPRNVSRRPTSQSVEEPQNESAVSDVSASRVPGTGLLVAWGVRRKVTYMDRHPVSSSERREGLQMNAVDDTVLMIKKRDLKRKDIGRSCGDKGTKKMARKEVLGRWSSERYKAAQMKLVDIMHAKGAVLGKPILRPELREAARKHIGDTGLLDHLLKHMTDTVIGNGERFRRRHNSEGAMEYWLEGANLVHQRKAAGIEDPFWIPPPDWKPGDPLLEAVMLPANQALEIARLKDEVAQLRRDLDSLRPSGSRSFGVIKKAEDCSLNFGIDVQNGDVIRKQLQEGIDGLLRKKAALEDDLVEVATSMNRMKDDMQRILEGMNSTKQPEGKTKEEISSNGSGDESSGGVAAGGAVLMDEHVPPRNVASHARSGFRLCKPQGTFLWPGMASGTTSMVQNFAEEILPSPHACPLLSSSSGTGEADYPAVPSNSPLSPLKPRPARAAAVVVVAEHVGEVDSRSARKPNLTVQVDRGSATPNHPLARGGFASAAVLNCASPSAPSLWLGLATPSPTSVAYP